MKVYAIYIFNCTDKDKPVILTKAVDLSSFGFFQRSSADEVITFVAREVTKKTTDKLSVEHHEYVGYSRVNATKLGAAVLTDTEYPPRVAHHIASLALEKFSDLYTADQPFGDIGSDTTLFTTEFEALLKRSQNPDEVDDVEKIRKDLDETNAVLHKTISDLLVRGEKLDDLADQSEDLGAFSREFLKKSESMNACCLLL